MAKMFYPVITVTLNPAIDKSVIVDNFRPGSDFRCREVHESAGGKGINVSRALKGLNVPNLALLFAAGPSGEFIKRSLMDEKISAQFVMTSGNTRTSLTIIDMKFRRSTRVLEPGPDISNREARSFQQF
jgi:1-phosphofructokinase